MGRLRDHSIMDLDHTIHCAGKLMMPGLDMNAWGTTFQVSYPKCGGQEVDENGGKFKFFELEESNNP